MITREILARKLSDYLQHRITLPELVDWAERAMMEDEFDARDLETIRDITSRIGLAMCESSVSPGKTAKTIWPAWVSGPKSTSFKQPEHEG